MMKAAAKPPIVQRDIEPCAATRIKRIEVTTFAFPMDGVGKDARGYELVDRAGDSVPRTRLAVAIETEDGARGAYVGGNETMTATTIAAARSMIGKDCFAREQFYGDMKRKMRKNDRMGASLIDIALWDLAGKRLGASVSQLLGGSKTRVKAYASTWFGGDDGGLATPEAFADFAEECHAMGYSAYKMHGWSDGDPRRDIAAVRLLGKRVGDRMALMHDAACQIHTFADALALGRACDEANFFWWEDPYSDGGLAAHAHKRLRELVRTPMLLGEHVRGLESMATLTLAGGTDFIRADPDFDLGITGTMKIAHFAEALGLDVELHAPGPAHRHCIAAIRNTNYYELSLVGPSRGCFTPDCYSCGYTDRLEAVGSDGCFPVPEGPGLGVEINWDWIARHKVSSVALG
jgi:L-alanine-DL-glutamate epimerase-like enolase superfamily enzyme